MTVGQGHEGPFAALDEYDTRHLVTHLLAGGRARDVHRLLRMEAAGDHRNEWFAERERRGDVAGYLDDVARGRAAAADTVADAITKGEPAMALPLELRYALITSSISSQSRSVPPALLAALASSGMWSLTQALTYAAQQPFAPLRAEAFTLLAGQCGPRAAVDCLRQARSAAGEIRHRPDWRVRALGQIAAHAPPELRREVVGEALDVLREIGSIEADENVATLVAAAGDDLRDEVEAVLGALPVTAVKPIRAGIEDLGGRPAPWTYGVRRFAGLLPALGEPLRQAILGAFRDGPGEPVYRGIVIGAGADRDPALAAEALEIAGSIPEARLRAEVIAVVSPCLDDATRGRVLGELLGQASESDDPATTAEILTAIAPAVGDADPPGGG